MVIRKRDGEGRENWRAELKFKENFLKEVDLALSPSRSWKVRERNGERNGWKKQDYRKLRSQNIETMVSYAFKELCGKRETGLAGRLSQESSL